MMHFLRSSTILYCRRWRQTVDFYRDRLNLAVHFESDWLVEFKLYGAAYLSVADALHATIPSSAGSGITLYFKADDVESVYYNLTVAGVSSTAIRPV